MSPSWLNKISNRFSMKGSSGGRPPFEPLYPYILAAFIGFMAADLTIIYFRDRMLPTSPPPARRTLAKMAERKDRFEYEKILQRNMFNSDGVIPPPIGKGAEDQEQPDNVPVPSQLPLTLVGTIVHANPGRSIASIELKNGGKIIPFVPNDEIEGLATIVKIDRKRVVIRNLNNSRLEYIEIKEVAGVTFETSKKPQTGTAVEKVGNTFNLKRDDVNALINNLPDVLQQARAVPNIVPGSGGRVDGFRILDIAPGSIFEKLGLQRMDVIKGVNGQPVDSPARALELYNNLKDSAQVTIEIDRGGKKENFQYNIN